MNRIPSRGWEQIFKMWGTWDLGIHTHHRRRHGRNAFLEPYSLQCRGTGEEDVDTKVGTQVGSKVAFPNALLSYGHKKINQPKFPANFCLLTCRCSFTPDKGVPFHHALGSTTNAGWWAECAVEDSYLSDCSALKPLEGSTNAKS